MRYLTLRPLPFLMMLLLPVAVRAELQVVTTLPSYAAIARAVGGDRVAVRSISLADEDSHFVKPKPSYALMLRHADLFVTTGLDLELWGPALVDKSGNRRIRDGADGYVVASQNVPMLDVPANASRAAGDIHIYGNPHIHTSPINAKIIAANIAAGLVRVDPEGGDGYRENLATFQRQIDISLYGEELVDMLGAEILDPLARQGTLIEFLRDNTYRERPLIERLGGWLEAGMSFRDREIIAYHKNWIYFTALFGIEVIDFVESKPGIPPSARHVHNLIHQIEDQGIGVLLSATYFAASKPGVIAERTGCRVVRLSLGSGEDESYVDLVDRWVGAIAAAFAAEE